MINKYKIKKIHAKVVPQPCPFRSYCPGACDWCETHDYSEACVPLLVQRVHNMNRIDHEARRAVYDRAIMQYGTMLQAIVALEELSEAQKEICKCLRGKASVNHLAEEVADAAIMLEQISMIYEIEDSVRSHIDAKVQRLADNLERDSSEKD